MSRRVYDGPALDGTYQHFSERPYNGDDDGDETVYATPREDQGEEQTENVPVPDGGQPKDVDGQTTLADWGWSP